MRIVLSATWVLVVAVMASIGTVGHAVGQTWHGLSYETLTFEKAEAAGLVVFEGAIITNVAPKSPAAANLKPGDVITYALGDKRQRIVKAEDLTGVLRDVARGSKVTLVRARKDAATAKVVLNHVRPDTPTAAQTAAVLSTAPVLMLDTGGHMSVIRDVHFTPDGKQLVSAGDDKVIRVWSLKTGKTVRTIRGDVSPGPPGKLYGMTLSGDGRWLAAAGWLTGPRPLTRAVRIYDFASGTMVALLKGHKGVIDSLQFSSDSQYLVSSSKDNSAIVWQAPLVNGAADWRQGKQLHHLRGHIDDIYAVTFLPDGQRVVTGSDDRTLRVWDLKTGSLLAQLLGHRDRVRSVAVTRDQAAKIGDNSYLLASGDRSGEVRLWRAQDLTRASNAAVIENSYLLVKQKRNAINGLAFSKDGRHLLVNCGQKCSGDYTPRLYNLATRKYTRAKVKQTSIVLTSSWTNDGQWIATAGGSNQEIHVWSPATGLPKLDDKGNPIVLVGGGRPVWGTAVSPDNAWIGWGNKWRFHTSMAKNPIQFALQLPNANRSLGAPVRVTPQSIAEQGVPKVWRRAFTRTPQYRLSHRRGGKYGFNALMDVHSGERLLATLERQNYQGEDHRAYGFTTDRTGIISGGSFGVLQRYDLKGVLNTAKGGTITGNQLDRHTKSFVGHESAIWAATPSPDGRFLVSGAADQTMRFWNMQTRELVFTLFHAPAADGGVGDWVIWTPQGFYTGSPDAGRLVGWQLNNGPSKTADYVTGGQFRKTLNRRDILERAIVLASAKRAVAELAPNHNLARLLSARPPVLTLATPDPYSTAFRGYVDVTAFVQKGSFDVERYVVSVNDFKVKTVRAPIPRDHPRPPNGQLIEGFKIPLGEGENDIVIKAVSSAGESQAMKLRVSHNGEGPLDKRGTLHVLAVGVDKYAGLGSTCGSNQDESCDLSYAGKDAQLFAKSIKSALGPRHTGGVKVRVLANGGAAEDRPTASNILAALDDLADAGPIDTVAVFLAGHGERGSDGGYYFLPTDIRRSGGFEAVGTGRNILEWSKIQERLTKPEGRRLIFLDACQSGAVGAARAYNGRLLEDAQYENFVAFMASGPNQAAIERRDLGQGLFTHALAQGIAGAAHLPGERIVRVLKLGSYIADQVWELSNGRQRPVYTPHADFVLAAQ